MGLKCRGKEAGLRKWESNAGARRQDEENGNQMQGQGGRTKKMGLELQGQGGMD